MNKNKMFITALVSLLPLTVLGGELETKLVTAIQSNSLPEVKKLLTKGANPSGSGQYGELALNAAIQSGDEKIARQLLKAGADVNGKNRYGTTVAETALASRKAKVWFDILIEAGIDINGAGNSGRTLLMSAVSERPNIELVELLIEKGAKVSAKDDRGNSVLHHAMRANKGDKVAVVETLLKHKVDVNAKDKSGVTPLMSAAVWEHITREPVVPILIKHGADPLVEDNSGKLALSYLLSNNSIPDASLLALTKSKYTQKQLDSMLHMVAKNGVIVNLHKMVEMGADVKSSYDGSTALIKAVSSGEWENARELIRLGVDVNAKDEIGNTALSLAAHNEKQHLVKLLLQHGANPDVQGEWGQPLVLATLEREYFDITKMLLAAGADLAADYDGQSIKERIAGYGYDEISPILDTQQLAEHKQALGLNQPLEVTVERNKEYIVGDWKQVDEDYYLTFKEDGTFSSEFDGFFKKVKDQGNWYVENGDLVMATNEKGKKRVIRHPILQLEKDQIVRYNKMKDNGQVFERH